MGVFDSVTGAADHLAGSVDESIGRQFDDEPGGGFADITETGERAEVDTDGDGEPEEFNNRYLQGDTVRTLYDATFDYDGTLNDEEDTVDLVGPTVGQAGETAADVATGNAGWKVKAAIAVVVVGALLYLARPVLTIVAGVAE